MIKLYHNDMSVCAQKVRMTLAKKKLPCENYHLDLRSGDQQQPESLKLNPNTVVPTLVDAGRIPAWFDRLRERSSYVEAFDRWRNPSYEKLMMETGTETRAKIKTFIAGN